MELVMNQNILPDYLPWINQQISSQETLLEYIFKAEAMLNVILGSNFPDLSVVTLHDYLWGLSDIVEQAKFLNEGLLDALIKVAALMKASKEPSNGGGTVH